jgi:HSP20 family protein
VAEKKEVVAMAKSENAEKGQREQRQHESHRGEQRRGRSMTPTAGGGSASSRSAAWPLARFRSEFDRLFDDFFRGWGGLPVLASEADTGWGLDIDDQEDKIVVQAEAPGFEPDDFDLQVRDNQLVLCACQSEENQEEGGRQWRRRELYRSVPLMADVDTEHIDAKYRNGILTVTLPKTEQSMSRKIEVKG